MCLQMARIDRTTPLFLVAILSLAALAATPAAPAWAQPGTVLAHSKVNSATMAAIGAVIDDGDEFGDAVAALGDLDGAGPSVAAVAVGAINDDDGGAHLGAVYILFLNASGGVLSHTKISSTQGNFTGTLEFGDELGSSITSLGDLDGPGPSAVAIAVGVINDDDGGPDRGAVYILFLNAAGSVIAQQKISDLVGGFTATLDDNDEFGGAVASLGDLDGAGGSAAALAVGAVYDDDGGLDRGAVYVLFLNTAGSVVSYQKYSSSLIVMTGALTDGDNFGEDVCSLGDLDGAGPSVRAIAVGAVGDDDGGSDRGAVYILFLNSSGTVLSRKKISDVEGSFTALLLNDDNFGTSVANLGNLDGAGPAVLTLAVGAAGDEGAGIDRGALYLLYLDATGKTLSHQEISSVAGGFTGQINDSDEFGAAVAPLGDIYGVGGGAMTVICGVGVDDDGGTDRGAFYLMTLAGTATVGVGDDADRAWSDGLGAARPSVFLHQTTLPFRLSAAGRVRIDVWDAGGRRVRRVFDAEAGPGEHRTIWDGADDSGRRAPPGAYFLRMSVEGRTVGGGARVVRLR